jgi:hypothetical protein
MMKTIRLLLVAFLPLVPAGNAPAEPKPLPFMLAQQQLGTCKIENGSVPAGTRMCVRQYVMVCSAHGTWQNTGEAC